MREEIKPAILVLVSFHKEVDMFERYTESSRRVMFFARFEAAQFRDASIVAPEHLLLGLFREDGTLVRHFLGPDVNEITASIRKKIEARTPLSDRIVTKPADQKFNNECKRILGYAAEEAERAQSQHIRTEHLLLGILREEGCFAAKILDSLEVRLDTARKKLLSLPATQR